MKPKGSGPRCIADRIWLWPSDPDPSKVQSTVGIVCGAQETILIDAGNSPALAVEIQAWLKESRFPPVGHILLTHHHWDHTYGACAFNAPITAHTQCLESLKKEAGKPWSQPYLAQEMIRDPRLEPSYRARARAVKDWEHFRIVLPDSVINAGESLVLDGIHFELEHVGGQHAEDSMVIRIPHAGMVFLGDCYYPPPLHLRTPDSAPDFTMLASLINEDSDLYVEGHARPRSRAQLERWLHANR